LRLKLTNIFSQKSLNNKENESLTSIISFEMRKLRTPAPNGGKAPKAPKLTKLVLVMVWGFTVILGGGHTGNR